MGVFFKRRLKYKSTYVSGNVRPNIVMMALQDLIETPLYKDLNVTICLQCTSLFAMYTQSQLEANLHELKETEQLDEFEEDP